MATMTSVDEELTSQSEAEPESPSYTPDRRQDLFNKLHDSEFAKIFRYLDLFQRVRVERVCKRWQEMAFLSWNEQKELRFNSAQFSIFGGRKPLQNMTFKVLLCLVTGTFRKSSHLLNSASYCDAFFWGSFPWSIQEGFLEFAVR